MNAPSARAPKSKNTEWEQKRAGLWIAGLHALGASLFGLSMFPMVALLYAVWHACAGLPVWVKLLAFSFSIGVGYFAFGLTLIFLAVAFKRLFRFRIAPGLYTMYSDEGCLWAGYNSLILVANSAFLDVLRVSPFQTLFYRLMGAKIGKDVSVNTGGLADLALLEIGDHVLIGGGTAIICHAFERGLLRLAPTKIGNFVSIGLNTIVMPDCEIGDGAVIAPCSLLPKGTRIPPKGHWGGNPVKDLRAERRAALAEEG
jgi:non-ribosomal peptide synthetase-like protein